MFPTIRAIFGVLNPLVIFKSNPRFASSIVLSLALMLLHHGWNVRLDPRVAAANARLEKAGLIVQTKAVYPAPTIPDEQNAAFQYAKADRLLYKIHSTLTYLDPISSTLSPQITAQEQEVLNLLRQARGLKHEYNTHIQRYDTASLVNLCANVGIYRIKAGDIDTAAEYIADARQIIQAQIWIDPESTYYTHYLTALQFIATQHKPGDKLKTFLNDAITGLEDPTPFIYFYRDQIARQFRTSHSLNRVDAFDPLGKILYDYEVTYYIDYLNNGSSLSLTQWPKGNKNILYDSLREITHTQQRPLRYTPTGYRNGKWEIQSVRTTQAAIAFQLYRVDHGEFPQNASSLVPQYLPDSFKQSNIRLVNETYSDNTPRPLISAATRINDRFLKSQPTFYTNDLFADLVYRPYPWK